jgi:hypothetical protein
VKSIKTKAWYETLYNARLVIYSVLCFETNIQIRKAILTKNSLIPIIIRESIFREITKK